MQLQRYQLGEYAKCPTLRHFKFQTFVFAIVEDLLRWVAVGIDKWGSHGVKAWTLPAVPHLPCCIAVFRDTCWHRAGKKSQRDLLNLCQSLRCEKLIWHGWYQEQYCHNAANLVPKECRSLYNRLTHCTCTCEQDITTQAYSASGKKIQKKTVSFNINVSLRWDEEAYHTK